MMNVFTSMIFTLVLVVLIRLFWKRNGRKSLPGPIGLPIVGYLPFLISKEYPFVKMRNLKEKYGPIYSLRLGSKHVVILSDYALIKEAFSRDAFTGRPKELPFEYHKQTMAREIITGVPWTEQRKLAVQILSDLGFGKTSMEELMKKEIQMMLESLHDTQEEPYEYRRLLCPSVSNNIASLVFGKRMRFDDPMRMLLDRFLCEGGLVAPQVSWQVFFPWLKPLGKIFDNRQKGVLKMLHEVMRYIEDEIEEHDATFNPNNIRDFIDGYLLEIKKRSHDPHATFTKAILADMARALFGAGSETVRAAVEWLILTMAAYPEVQKKVQAEIDDVIGQTFPTRADHGRMPYTEAVVLETNRWKPILPITAQRCTLEETELNGYFIPKDSFVFANLWAVHNDPQLWGKGIDDFRPERFLSEDGKRVVKPDYYIPFSIGKRSCPGRPLAEVEVFLYFVAILQRFNVSLPKGQVADFNGIFGFGFQPKIQRLCFRVRK